MLQEKLLLLLSLLFVVSMLTMLAEKVKISYPIFLVIAGLSISFIPGIHEFVLEPDMVFLIFLPPLLYSAAWNTSWKQFWAARRAISLMSIGLVIFTSTAVALVSSAIIPNFPLAYGFLLGGIISPPDAVAATSVFKNLRVPNRVLTILEGESLINDASSLIVFRFALAAIFTGQFTIWKAGGEFLLVAGMGILIGVAIAGIVYFLHRCLPTTSSIDTALSLISPYIMYMVAEHFHFSGVLAVVSGGLFLSFRSNKLFGYNSRIQISAFWQTFTFLLNGIVFILIGLQLPQIISGLGEFSLGVAIFYAIVISLLTIIIRILWVFPGAYLPRKFSREVRQRETKPSWKVVFLVGWSGMRGVISLAAALAIPLSLPNGFFFPHRNLMLFITFVVILFTLVLQGLSLPFLIKKLKIEESVEDENQQKVEIKLRLAEISLKYLNDHYSEEINEISSFKRIKERYERMVLNTHRHLSADWDDTESEGAYQQYREMAFKLVAVQREELEKIHKETEYPEAIVRSKERELDLEEARLNE